MKSRTANGWKTCSRGHKYRGSFCDKCMPGRAAREAKAAGARPPARTRSARSMGMTGKP